MILWGTTSLLSFDDLEPYSTEIDKKLSMLTKEPYSVLAVLLRTAYVFPVFGKNA